MIRGKLLRQTLDKFLKTGDYVRWEKKNEQGD